MTCRPLTVAAIEALHKLTIDRIGGSHGLRDRGLLESAAARPDHLAYYEPEATLGHLAATLAWGLIRNHAFIDGNKRVGYISLLTLLDLNGYTMACSEMEETEVTLRAAAGTISEEQWTAWVVRNAVARQPS